MKITLLILGLILPLNTWSEESSIFKRCVRPGKGIPQAVKPGRIIYDINLPALEVLLKQGVNGKPYGTGEIKKRIQNDAPKELGWMNSDYIYDASIRIVKADKVIGIARFRESMASNPIMRRSIEAFMKGSSRMAEWVFIYDAKKNILIDDEKSPAKCN